MTTLTRRALGVLAVTAATLGAATAPALAAQPVAAPSVAGVVSGNGGAGSFPTVYIMRPAHVGDTPAGRVTPVVPGYPITELGLAFQLGGRSSTYTDVHFTTSNPGTASCDMSKIYSEIAKSGWLYECRVTLPAMKPGTSKYYWVTMTGKRDGVPFKVTKNTLLYSPNIEVGIYVDGKRIDGTRYRVPTTGTQTIRYVVDNHTPRAIEEIWQDPNGGTFCHMNRIPAGHSGVCTTTLDRRLIEGAWKLGRLEVSYGNGVWGALDTARPTYLVTR